MVWIICGVIAIATLGFTLFVRDQDVPAPSLEDPKRKELELRKSVVYENLKDLQFEFRQGKLSDADYQALKAGFQVELAGIMDSIDHLPPVKSDAPKAGKAVGAGRPSSERDKPAANAKSSVAVKCAFCGAEANAASKFCGQCGKPLRA